MALKLKGSTSGFVGLDAPSVAGNNTLILPENSGSAFQLFANDITAGVTTFTQVTVSRNGDLTVPGTISIGGTLTYEDVTSVDSIGIVTARGLSIFGNTTGLQVASGISTFQAVTGTTGTFSTNADGTTDVLTLHADADGVNNGVASIKLMGNAGNHAAFIKGGHTTNGDTILTFHTDAHASGINPVERLRIDSEGRLLLGTTTQGETTADDLTIATSGSTGITIRAGTSNASNILFADGTSGDDAQRGIIQYHHSDDTMRLFTNATRRITITSNGHILIGTATDYADANSDDVQIYSTGDTGMSITSGTSNFGSIYFGDSTSANSDRNRGIVRYNHASDDLQFWTAATSRVIIDSVGRLKINGATSGAKISMNVADGSGLGSGSDGLRINSGTPNCQFVRLGTSYSYGGATGSGGASFLYSYDALRIMADTNKEMTFHTGGDIRMQITGAGKLFIAKTSGSAIVDINASNSTLRLTKENNSDYCGFQLDRDATTAGGYFGIAGAAGHYADNSVQNDVVLRSQSNLIFAAGGNGEKMRIDSSTGAVGVNDSTNGWAERFQVTGNYNNQYGIAVKITQSSGSLMRFGTTSGVCGSITGNGTNSAYNTSSDYRLKENDVSITDGISRVKQLRPIKFNWKTDPSTTQDGFFAHEVSPVVPESVTGEKDASIDEIGAGYQMIDHSKLVPLLTAALQEAITKIETLEAKVATLEGS